MEKHFNEIYSEHKEFIWNITSKYFQNKWDREEAFQEIFVKIHRYLPAYKENGQNYLKTWLYKIAITTSINFFKKQKRVQMIKDVIGFNERLFFRDQQPSNETTMRGKEESVDYLLKPLNANQRAVIVLREIEGLPYEEISEIMNVNIGTVKSMLNRSKIKIREYLKKEGICNGRD
ncbi:MAG: hypothetical protein DKM50_11810 [Candidatus Margulisiibacteriota bacterium]|nr:MAG: hypothetical protein A2X43_04835 [Candidatus Margulisbacteria bacterium GWD2_39_127]OGI03633.1 MAG: hypothetical protein A2X42_01220 [Candidatus Margulisbacteria bacterium GWF2_38_17]OGI11137.1 MAG: hypothetical protein A2X41_02515 [Candidatus Margulisbacteria bacterium GWE2_39_32]PZM78240.1 MAG: hypothetical protein DKM50_11810 [Candidatus Margulisiibacteriota bacterium]HAR64354.1 hypothetical protein [Candidatus Margulisiibacteriota bacterium]